MNEWTSLLPATRLVHAPACLISLLPATRLVHAPVCLTSLFPATRLVHAPTCLTSLFPATRLVHASFKSFRSGQLFKYFYIQIQILITYLVIMLLQKNEIWFSYKKKMSHITTWLDLDPLVNKKAKSLL